MSNKKKKKQNQKKMSAATKEKVRLGFATLISNEACVRASREIHGLGDIAPITIGLLSVVLAVLPTFISRINVSGAAVVFPAVTSASSGNYEQGLADFTYDLTHDAEGNHRNIEVFVDSSGVPHFETISELTGNDKSYVVYIRSSTNTPAFAVYFNNTAFLDADYFRAIDAGLNPDIGHGEAELKTFGTDAYACSYIAFGKETIRFRKRTTTQVAMGLTGRYDRMKDLSFTHISRALQGLEPIGLGKTSEAYLSVVRAFYTDVVNRSYETDKVSGAWQYTGIFAAVDLGLILVFGLVIFLMTRGKKNPYRIYNFYHTVKMACWASLAPAILALALGFWLVQYAFILFMFLFGMRMMWLSMRTFRPTA